MSSTWGDIKYEYDRVRPKNPTEKNEKKLATAQENDTKTPIRQHIQINRNNSLETFTFRYRFPSVSNPSSKQRQKFSVGKIPQFSRR